jgi:spore coat protein CotF
LTGRKTRKPLKRINDPALSAYASKNIFLPSEDTNTGGVKNMNINLTTKERMLLEDQKKHEQVCIEKYNNYAQQATDPQLKAIFSNNGQQEQQHLNTLNQILSGQVPAMNQQGGGQTNQAQNAGTQQTNQSAGIRQNNPSISNDQNLCTDILMTEKYVSGGYNTAIFEFKDTEVRDVLNHIQKEEQKHGEAVFKYMESKGWYNPQ